MKLIFESEVIQLGTDSSTNEIVKTINELLKDDYYYSHFVVDGEEVHQNPERYLAENLTNISRLEIKVKTCREFVYETLLMAENYLNKSKGELEKIHEEFYRNPTSNTWDKFSNLIEGMQWLNQMISLVDKDKTKPRSWYKCVNIAKRFDLEAKNLEEAVENSDNILIADIIQYEISSIYKELETEINNLINSEDYQYGIN